MSKNIIDVQDEYKKAIYKEKRLAKATFIFTIIAFTVSIIWLYFSFKKVLDFRSMAVEQEKTIAEMKVSINRLSSTQTSLLEFLGSVTGRDNVHIFDSSVEWEKVKNDIVQMPAGKRKDAIIAAILLTWKDIPFTMGSDKISSGFDSPRFLQYVLSKEGVIVKPVSGERLSDTMMKLFQKVDNPKPGDLVFYKGQEGSFGFILASAGNNQNPPVGIGTLQRIAPLQIISLNNINTPYFPLIGYFRVKYPDE